MVQMVESMLVRNTFMHQNLQQGNKNKETKCIIIFHRGHKLTAPQHPQVITAVVFERYIYRYRYIYTSKQNNKNIPIAFYFVWTIA